MSGQALYLFYTFKPGYAETQFSFSQGIQRRERRTPDLIALLGLDHVSPVYLCPCLWHASAVI